MKNKRLLSIVTVVLLTPFLFMNKAQVPAKLNILRVGESLACPSALKVENEEQLVGQAFQQDALISYNGYQYTVYYTASRHLSVARRKLPMGKWMEVQLPYKTGSIDPHNVPCIGICPKDGTIHLSYDHHDDQLHYCRSLVGLASDPENREWNVGNFNANTHILYNNMEVSGVCYPRFINKPDSNLLFECRHGSSGSGDSYLREYDGATHQWSLLGRYLQGKDTGVNAYINRLDYDVNGRLHLTWMWRESPAASTNHDICYAYSDDNGKTWYNRTGIKVGEIEKTEPGAASNAPGKCLRQGLDGLVVNPVQQQRGLINQESQSSDARGWVHALNSYMPENEPDNTNWSNSRSKATLRHQFLDADGTWNIKNVKKDGYDVVSSCRAQIVCDALNNVYVVANRAEVYAATTAQNYDDWGLVSHTDAGRFCSEPQIDRKLINEGLLSFVYMGKDTQWIIIDYLLDNPHTPDGSGLHAEYFSDEAFNTLIEEAGNTHPSDKTGRPTETKSIRWSGVLETLFGEKYRLFVNTAVPFKLMVDGKNLLEKSVPGEYSVELPLIASHKHNIILEALASSSSDVSVSWSSAHTSQSLIPPTSLYPEKLKTDYSKSVAKNNSGTIEPYFNLF